MPRSINKFTFAGNAGRDAEILSSKAGKQYAKFSLALTESRKDKDGNFIDETSWINCVTYDEYLVKAAATIKKGDYVFATGKIKVYKGKDGVTYMDVIIRNFDGDIIINHGKNEKPKAAELSGDYSKHLANDFDDDPAF